MQNSGTIYVVMPAYNVEKFIASAFDSLLAQTYHDWKCLCVNDGSQDKTWEIMQDYAQKDNRFLIFNHENQGVTSARNFLLDKVEGPYLSFMDADDYLHPQMFEILVNNIKKTNVDIVECNIDRFEDFVPSEKLQSFNEGQIKSDLLEDMSLFLTRKTWRGGWINIVNKLYCWDKIKKIRFSPELSYEDDYFFSSLVHSVLARKLVLSVPLYFYRKNPTSLCHSVNWEKYQKAGLNRIRLSYEYFVKGKRLPADKKDAFMYDLAQDAYRMIVRKPLKKGKNKALFNEARHVMKNYQEKGIVLKQYLSFGQRIHLWFVVQGFYRISLLWSKLT